MQSQDEGLGYPTERGKDKYASRMTNGNRGDTAFRLSICACSALIDKGMRVGNIKQSHRMNIDLTSIILALITLLGGCGWLLDRKKHRQEVEGLKADNRQKDMELGKMYVDEFRSNIADPLRQEVLELRNEIDQLRNAIQRIADCPHSGTCPVRLQLLNESHIDA